jgi:hypothetical protein
MLNVVGWPIVPILSVTRDEQGLVGRTNAVLHNACYKLQRVPVYVHSSCFGYAQVRTGAFQEAKKSLPPGTKTVRGFMIDDDILLMDMDAVVAAMQIADRNNWNIVAGYRTKTGHICVCHADARMFTAEEFSKLKPYDTVPLAGLGFYYGDLPLDYEFHADGKPFMGEDLNFFYDTKIEPRVAPIPLKHLKVIGI